MPSSCCRLRRVGAWPCPSSGRPDRRRGPDERGPLPAGRFTQDGAVRVPVETQQVGGALYHRRIGLVCHLKVEQAMVHAQGGLVPLFFKEGHGEFHVFTTTKVRCILEEK